MENEPNISAPTTTGELGVFLLSGEVTDETVRPIIEGILLAPYLKTPPKVLTLIVCSIGGYLAATTALVDIMASSTIPVHTVGLGLVSSGACDIFIAGRYRTLTTNSLVMSHQHSDTVEGKYHDLMASAVSQGIVQQQRVEHYRKCTGLTEQVITSKLLGPTDVWLRAADALALGMCDVVKDYNPRPSGVETNSKKETISWPMSRTS